jgi:hypothetical protein
MYVVIIFNLVSYNNIYETKSKMILNECILTLTVTYIIFIIIKVSMTNSISLKLHNS